MPEASQPLQRVHMLLTSALGPNFKNRTANVSELGEIHVRQYEELAGTEETQRSRN